MGRPKELNIFEYPIGDVFIENITNDKNVNIKSNETLKIINVSFKNILKSFNIDINKDFKRLEFEFEQGSTLTNDFILDKIEQLKKKTNGYTEKDWALKIIEIVEGKSLNNNYYFYYSHVINHLLQISFIENSEVKPFKINKYLNNNKNEIGHITKLKEDKHLISIEDLDSIFDKCNDLEKTIIGILISTGMRSKGFLNLKKDNIDFKNNTITTLEKGNKETKYLIVPFLLQRMIDTNFFDTKWDKPTFFKLIKGLNRYTNTKTVNIHPHAFRHTFATLLVKNGVSINEISKMLNHSSVKITEQYYVIENSADIAKRVNLPFNISREKENTLPKFWLWLKGV